MTSYITKCIKEMKIMILTIELLDNAKTVNGGYTRNQLKVFGVSWEPIKGWYEKP
jgi:hypothetical protein